MSFRLITSPTDKSALTTVRETDARTAICRGISEYMLAQSITLGGRLFKFQKAFESYAVTEEEMILPAVFVTFEAPMLYDASNLSPNVSPKNLIPQTSTQYLVSPSEIAQGLSVEVWAQDPTERMALCAMLEDVFNPLDWMYGFRLELGHYFNERATYALLSNSYIDDDPNDIKRYRRAKLAMSVAMPVSRILEFAPGEPRSRVVVTSSPLPASSASGAAVS